MLDAVVAAALADDDRTIVVTGASGWIGRATLDLLYHALGDAFANRVHCFGSSSRMLDLGDGRKVAQRALVDLPTLAARRAWLLHFAFQTKERADTMSEDAYREANRAIGDVVLRALDTINVAAVFVASSGAVTKVDDPAASAAMRLYGAMKRDEEDRFAAWAQARGKRAVIARVFNVTGPYINKHQAYAIASFIIDAIAGRTIAVRAPREVVRGYVAIRELMSLVFALMAVAPNGVVCFESGGEALELGAVARIVAEVLGVSGIDRAAIVDAVPDRYVGDGAAYATLLAEHGIEPVALPRQVRETAAWLRADTT